MKNESTLARHGTVQYILNLVKCKMNGDFSYNSNDFNTMRNNSTKKKNKEMGNGKSKRAESRDRERERESTPNEIERKTCVGHLMTIQRFTDR